MIVEGQRVQREAVRSYSAVREIEIVAVATVAEAREQLAAGSFDCLVTDQSLPDASGYDLLECMARDEAHAFPPVIVYTGSTLTADEEQRLRRFSSST